jgi:hypothetical protein
VGQSQKGRPDIALKTLAFSARRLALKLDLCFERRESNLTIATLNKIAQNLGTTSAALLKGIL